MTPRFRALLNFFSVCVLVLSFAVILRFNARPDMFATNPPIAALPPMPLSEPPASTTRAEASPFSSTSRGPRSVEVVPAKKSGTVQQTAAAGSLIAAAPRGDRGSQVLRIEHPYATPPESLQAANDDVRASLVNILCTTSGGSVHPISGSGVFIDPRGVILTNAHVAQYVLLSESPDFKLDCSVRTGSPAKAAWRAAVLYMPPEWVTAHAQEINTPDPTGTGEHDYALLLVTTASDGSERPQGGFPYLPIDVREAIGFPGDEVLVAGYPAEFIGGLATQNNLFAATSETTVRALLTFGGGAADLMSLGGVIEAQSGSSGGAVVNPWGRLIGLIVTTSTGAVTADRDLHTLTLNYIDRDLMTENGSGLKDTISGDLAAKYAAFNSTKLRPLLQQYFDVLKSRQE